MKESYPSTWEKFTQFLFEKQKMTACLIKILILAKKAGIEKDNDIKNKKEKILNYAPEHHFSKNIMKLINDYLDLSQVSSSTVEGDSFQENFAEILIKTSKDWKNL